MRLLLLVVWACWTKQSDLATHKPLLRNSWNGRFTQLPMRMAVCIPLLVRILASPRVGEAWTAQQPHFAATYVWPRSRACAGTTCSHACQDIGGHHVVKKRQSRRKTLQTTQLSKSLVSVSLGSQSFKEDRWPKTCRPWKRSQATLTLRNRGRVSIL